MIKKKLCKHCNQVKPLEKFQKNSDGLHGRRSKCKDCQQNIYKRESPAKILVFDVETAPIRGLVWGAWKQNINPIQIESDWFMLTWSAKWLFSDEVFADKLTPEEAKNNDDARISQSIWDLIDEADIVIAHNALKFDIKKINTRFLMNGLMPPSHYLVIDTLTHLRKKFSITHNRLDYVNDLLGLGRKIDTGGFQLWIDCMAGDKDALQKMETYNIEDVKILEETYLKIRPWIQPHPNLGLHIGEGVECCPSCGSDHLNWGGTPYRTMAAEYESFRCGQCGSTGRSKTSVRKGTETRPTNK